MRGEHDKEANSSQVGSNNSVHIISGFQILQSIDNRRSDQRNDPPAPIRQMMQRRIWLGHCRYHSFPTPSVAGPGVFQSIPFAESRLVLTPHLVLWLGYPGGWRVRFLRSESGNGYTVRDY